MTVGRPICVWGVGKPVEGRLGCGERCNGWTVEWVLGSR